MAVATKPKSQREMIEEFFSQKRIALAGVSRTTEDFSHTLFREFVKRGYDMVPVNPSATEIDGVPCYPTVSAIVPPVDGVLTITPAGTTDEVARDSVKAGVKRIWFYGITGISKASDEAVRLCEENGVQVINGYCPMMLFHDSGFAHHAHGFFTRLIGRYPR